MNTSLGHLREAQDIISSDLESAKTIINSTTPINSTEANEKNVLEIYLKYLENNFISESDYTNLVEIAQQNPLFGGTSVYWARALSQLDYEDFYTDPPQRIMKHISLEPSEFCKIFPNPAINLLNINILGKREGKYKFEMYNALGTLVLSVNIFNEYNSIQLSDFGINTGVYICEVRKDTKVVTRQKRIILE